MGGYNSSSGRVYELFEAESSPTRLQQTSTGCIAAGNTSAALTPVSVTRFARKIMQGKEAINKY